MNFTFICKHCGGKSLIPAQQLSSSDDIICPLCGKSSPNNALHSDPINQFSDNLNPEQEQAATYDGEAGGILLLSGAGCGKTRTMIARALFLLKVKKANPERMAMLTFTRRAAREIQDRLAMEAPGVEKRLFVGTFHRFCLMYMHRYPGCFVPDNFKIMDNNDEEVVLRKIHTGLISASHGRVGTRNGLVPKESEMASIFSYANNKQLSITEYYHKYGTASDETIELMEKARTQYDDYKKQNGYLDFDDILTVTAEQLKNNPELRRAVQNTLDYVLVDEMQDTSPVQWDILKAIYPPVQLFCVGDDAQSIYAFRGADFESVHHFCEVLPNSVTLKLTENYRSSQEILDIANMLMDASPLKYDKNLRSHTGPGIRKPRLYSFKTEDEEADFIVSMISQKLNDGVPPNEIMVLLRSMRNGRMLEHALRTFGIEYRLIGGIGFLQAAHVRDVVAIFESLTTLSNEISWIRALSILPRIGFKTAENLYAQVANQHDVRSALNIMAKKLKTKNPDAADFIANHFNPDGTPAEMLTQIVEYLDKSSIMELKYDRWQERKNDLLILINIAKKYSTPQAFLEAFKLDPSSEAMEQRKNNNVVTLITVHSAKGTEADICFVMRVQQGNYPHYRSKNAEDVEEDRRTLYVAMTRARKELYLTNVTGYFGYGGGYGTGECSPFLTDEMQCLLSPPKRRRR